MIIAIATNKQDIKAMVDLHFGRCEWYCLFDTENRESLFIANPVCNNQEKAGCNAAELLVGKNIGMAVAGRFGSRVAEVFRKNNIQMVIPETQKTVVEIINQIK
jgi:predicted Fe-Mo cluster-binding NifX family protein